MLTRWNGPVTVALYCRDIDEVPQSLYTCVYTHMYISTGVLVANVTCVVTDVMMKEVMKDAYMNAHARPSHTHTHTHMVNRPCLGKWTCLYGICAYYHAHVYKRNALTGTCAAHVECACANVWHFTTKVLKVWCLCMCACLYTCIWISSKQQPVVRSFEYLIQTGTSFLYIYIRVQPVMCGKAVCLLQKTKRSYTHTKQSARMHAHANRSTLSRAVPSSSSFCSMHSSSSHFLAETCLP